ncbi:hypothetical protein ZHAS_00011892 [Anopheles sinensis]|uniref:Uncharacterized protein n=1 Tax=Anopheles sinensis TaxID=74873 RepID=A0A084W1G7_ANOSI|nr:hypothetical protein ZHAS_00011892 [Anopheles sinensis]
MQEILSSRAADDELWKAKTGTGGCKCHLKFTKPFTVESQKRRGISTSIVAFGLHCIDEHQEEPRFSKNGESGSDFCTATLDEGE